MSFDVTVEAYARFMGRYSEPLATEFVQWAGVADGEQVLDVGCGSGILTAVLVARLGEDAVAAIDPSPSFVEATRARFPAADVRSGTAERLPFEDGAFDVTLSQLVVHFMTDPVAGLSEMRRVTRPGGRVAANAWDLAAGTSPLSTFWRAVNDVDPGATDESARPGTREGHLAQLCREAGLSDVESDSITVRVSYSSFDDWWEPYTLGVGPAGVYVANLDDAHRAALRDRCAQILPPAPFEVAGRAWCARAHA